MKKLVLFLLVALSSSLFAKGLVKLSTEEAKKAFDDSKALFIDARGFKLYQKGTIMGSINIPEKKFSKIKNLLPQDKNALIISFCNGVKCEKSDLLAEKIIKYGYTNVKVYPGGYPGWKEAKLPLMGLVKECKNEPKGEYKPKEEAVKINGVEVFPGGDDGMIDQFWLAQSLNKGETPKGIQLVDVRKEKDYKDGHIKGAINITYDSKTEKMDTAKLPKDGVVVFYCNTGQTSTDAFMALEKMGVKAENILYFDANVKCENDKCTIEPNEDL